MPIPAPPTQSVNATPALQMMDGTLSLGGKRVLDHMQLKLGQGETLVILGRSGSGKTVLLKCLSGLLRLDEGTVFIQGQDLGQADRTKRNLIRRKMGVLFQGAALYDSLSVRGNLAFQINKQLLIRDGAEVERLSREVLGDVGLEDAFDKMPSELSGGMRKRLGLARALVSKPGLMLYDEPTTGLDPVTSQEISHLIRETQRTRGVASIVVTHDLHCAKATGDRIVVLGGGACFAEGTYAQLEASADEAVRAFFL